MLESKEFILNNKTKVIVRFNIIEERNNLTWKVEDIKFKSPRQKDWRFLKDLFACEYEYRQLSTEDRHKYEYDHYVEFCGEEVIKAAYADVYARIKPSILTGLKEDITEFGDAAVKLTESITQHDAEDLVIDDYPFDKSFDELVLDILRWRDSVCNKL